MTAKGLFKFAITALVMVLVGLAIFNRLPPAIQGPAKQFAKVA